MSSTQPANLPLPIDPHNLPPIEVVLARLLDLYTGSPGAPPATIPLPLPIPPRGPSWADFSAEVLALYQSSRAKTTTGKMRQVLREFGAIEGVNGPADLTPLNVAAFKDASVAKGRAPISTSGLLSYLRKASSYAVSRCYLAASPFAAWSDWGCSAEASAELEVEIEGSAHHSLAEIGRVLDHLSTLATWEGRRLHALAATVAFTGLRKMEALSLRTADVKVDDRLIQIVKRRRLKRPTAAAPVPMAEELAEVLRSWLPQTGCGWCFPNLSRSGPWTGGSAGYTPLDRLKAAGLAVDVDGLTFQSLRHSWATHAESAWGLSELVVQRILRHTRTRTQDHYRHADKANLVEAVKGIRFGDRQAA